MKTFCEKCNSPIDPHTGLCPMCDGEKPKKGKNKGLIITAIILAVLVILAGTFFVFVQNDVWGMKSIFTSGETTTETNGSSEGTQTPGEATTTGTQSQQVVGLSQGFHNFTADTTSVEVGEDAEIVFSVEYVGSDTIGKDALAILDANNKVITYLNDDGKNGDKSSGDGIYSGKHKIDSSSVGGQDYHILYKDKKEESVPLTISVYRELTDEDFDSFRTLLREIASREFDDAKDYIKKSSEIKSYEIDDKQKTILYTSIYDITGLWHEELSDEVKGTGAAALTATEGADYYIAEQRVSSVDLTSAYGNTNVASIRPYANDGLFYSDFNSAGYLLSQALGGNYEDFESYDADLRAFCSMGNYGIVLIDSHSLVCNDQTYIITGQDLDNYDFIDGSANEFIPDVIAGNVVFTNTEEAAINGKFLTRNIAPSALEESIWYLGICNGTANKSITSALLDRGAYTVVGFNGEVSTQYCNDVLFEVFINSMILSSDTVTNGVEEAKKIYGKTDSVNTSCKVEIVGSTGYVVSETEEVTSDRQVVLVLDHSGSMAGTPLEETKKAAKQFVDSTVGEDVAVAAVSFDSYSKVLSGFSHNRSKLKNKIDQQYTGGSTNTESGLVAAQQLLEAGNAKKKIIILMTDGEENMGKCGDELVNYANELKEKGIIIYTLGFFHQLSNKAAVQERMSKIASEGCHFEVANAEDLKYFFGDISETIKGQRYIYITIACPVDVTVAYEGKKLSSEGKNPKTRTDYGVLFFQDNGTKDPTKILRLKEGPEYDIQIEGTGKGKMTYTIQFMDEEGEYNDKRTFKNIKINKRTAIDTVATVDDTTTLNIDNDGDGSYDITMEAEANGRGKEVDPHRTLKTILKIVGGIILLIGALIAFIILRKKWNKVKHIPRTEHVEVPAIEEAETNPEANHPDTIPTEAQAVDTEEAPKPRFCNNCGAALEPDANFCPNCSAKINK